MKKLLSKFGYAFVSSVCKYIELREAERNREANKLREKIKYFKPTITTSIFGRRVSWELRDKPLTDEELAKFE
jgi:hypothetical protein